MREERNWQHLGTHPGTREGTAINYKAHIPAGIAFSSAFVWALGLPLTPGFFIGGALGGALPDMDVEGAAVEKLGDKAAQMVHNMTHHLHTRSRIVMGLANVVAFVCAAFSFVIFTPMAKLWRNVIAKGLAKLYWLMYEGFGKNIGWTKDKVEVHRGGLTHSLTFMLSSLIYLLPFSLIFGTWDLLIGAELGIISHLVADSMCISGVKYFWPWAPKLGFADDSHPKGRDIRIFPVSRCVHTGKDRLSDEDIKAQAKDKEERKRLKTLRAREIRWQWIFKILAFVFTVLIIAGIGPGSSAFAMSKFDSRPPIGAELFGITLGDGNANANSNSNSNQPAENTGQSQNAENANDGTGAQSVPSNTEEIDLNAVKIDGVIPVERPDSQTGAGISVKEVKGPTSLTFGDISIDDLPVGVMKMPDESLYIIDVGPVTADNLDNPRWSFTEEEKTRLLAASGAMRVNNLPRETLQKLSETAKDAGDAASNAANDAGNAAKEKGDDLGSWFRNLLGLGDGGDFHWGFVGITPYTQASSSE